MATYEISKTKPGAQFIKGLGGSLSSVISGNVTFEIEHITTTKNFRSGKKDAFYCYYVEIGRNTKCLIQYDETCEYVSRSHAAIVYDKGKWMLRHLSKTNPTLINNNPVQKEYFLKDGDIVQLSYEGPSFRFCLPTSETAKATFSNRTAILNKQLKIHQRIIIPVLLVLIMAIAGLTFFLIDTRKENIALRKEINDEREQRKIDKKQFEQTLKNAKDIYDEDNKKKRDDTEKTSKTYKKYERAPKVEAPVPEKQEKADTLKEIKEKEPIIIVTPANTEQFLIQELDDDILQYSSDSIILKSENNKEILYNRRIEGVGFFILNGKTKLFVTTRQMIAPWDYYIVSDDESFNYDFNQLVNNANPKPSVKVPFRLQRFKTKFYNSDFIISTKDDEYLKTTGSDGKGSVMQRGVPSNNWAKSGLIPKTSDIGMIWDPSMKLTENDTLYICAMSNIGLVVDLCIFKSIENNRMIMYKHPDLHTRQGAPVVFIRKGNDPKHKPKIYIAGMVTGFPDEGLILPLSNFINIK